MRANRPEWESAFPRSRGSPYVTAVRHDSLCAQPVEGRGRVRRCEGGKEEGGEGGEREKEGRNAGAQLIRSAVPGSGCSSALIEDQAY